MNLALLIRCDPHLMNKISYVFETLLHTIGVRYRQVASIDEVEPADLLIGYGPSGDLIHRANTLVIRSSPEAVSYFKHAVAYDAAHVTMLPWRGKALPVLFAEPGASLPLLIAKGPATLVMTHDLIASAFFFLSCWQELTHAARDQFNRFPYAFSLQSRLQLGARPIVAEYLQVLSTALETIHAGHHERLAAEPLWPRERACAVCLTHDVHRLKKWTSAQLWTEAKHGVGLVVKHRRSAEGLTHLCASLQSLVTQENPVAPRLLLDQERRYGLHSSFYVMTGGSAPQDRPPYWRDRAALDELIRAVEQAGCEVGLHGSYEGYRRADLMEQEKARVDALVRRQPYGGRQHFLRFETPITWRLQQEVGLQYDSTVYFAEQAGFRAGFCFPYQAYDVVHDRKLDIWELPLTVMDGTLRDYQRLGPEDGFQVIDALIRTVQEHRGLFVLLWHADFSGASPAWAPVYERILQAASSDDVFAGSGRDIINWWVERKRKLIRRT